MSLFELYEEIIRLENKLNSQKSTDVKLSTDIKENTESIRPIILY